MSLDSLFDTEGLRPLELIIVDGGSKGELVKLGWLMYPDLWGYPELFD